MTEIFITPDMAVDLLEQVVEERGKDFVYKPIRKGAGSDSCLYTDGVENYSCMIGGALLKAGVRFEVLKAIDFGGAVALSDYDEETGAWLDEPREIERTEGMDDTSIDESGVQFWLEQNGVTLSDGALSLFVWAQREQDDGKPYGQVVSTAMKLSGLR